VGLFSYDWDGLFCLLSWKCAWLWVFLFRVIPRTGKGSIAGWGGLKWRIELFVRSLVGKRTAGKGWHRAKRNLCKSLGWIA